MTTKKTALIHCGRQINDTTTGYPVNPSVMRASTILFKDTATWNHYREARKTERVLSYGARGTQTNIELENMITTLEGGYRTQLFPTGLAALATVLLHYAKNGGHILITDGIYAPVRQICDTYLEKYNTEIEFLNADCSDLYKKIRPETCLVLCESPASVLYELIDLPKITAIAHKYGVPVAIDNTYGSGYFFNPLKHGADISIIAATKYLCGHSDVVMGAVVCNEQEFSNFGNASEVLGMTTSPDDAYLVLRGMRTLDIRLRAHEQSALTIADFFMQKDIIKTVYHPALPHHPGHDIWKRDFTGSNGMLTIEFEQTVTAEQAVAFVDNLQLFGIGASWGGFESLASVVNPVAIRTQTNWSNHGQMIRFHIGLESVTDLIADIEQSMCSSIL
ncbi:cystathionine beta-lyase [Vibrio sp. HA2012]|uniref:cystathionine beta-lyase n=1 Tax=Vibrio sp. HA2012 TaxID=1971595 RepID=UPI000C2CCBF8|nr:cystathionine beta-lyase [Vibrio sp. HA2012]PJC86846.1 cystathionine beta-lyase [Vibrio sp. HA2012]